MFQKRRLLLPPEKFYQQVDFIVSPSAEDVTSYTHKPEEGYLIEIPVTILLLKGELFARIYTQMREVKGDLEELELEQGSMDMSLSVMIGLSEKPS